MALEIRFLTAATNNIQKALQTCTVHLNFYEKAQKSFQCRQANGTKFCLLGRHMERLTCGCEEHGITRRREIHVSSYVLNRWKYLCTYFFFVA